MAKPHQLQNVELGTIEDGTGAILYFYRSDVGARPRFLLVTADAYSGRITAYLTKGKVQELIKMLQEGINET